MKKELVIAAYERDLSWVNNINDDIKITTYRKGEKITLKNREIKIEPNSGRCVHTFFNHIYIQYDNLSDLTFFVQDYPFDHWGDLIDIINNTHNIDYLKKTCTLNLNDGYFGYYNTNIGVPWKLEETSHFKKGGVLKCLSNGYPHDNNPLINVDKYWEILITNKKPNNYEFIPGGHFCISKEQVHFRSKNFYETCCNLLINDPVAPWIFERLECYLFNKEYNTKF